VHSDVAMTNDANFKVVGREREKFKFKVPTAKAIKV
jgi:hypothetical protein